MFSDHYPLFSKVELDSAADSGFCPLTARVVTESGGMLALITFPS